MLLHMGEESAIVQDLLERNNVMGEDFVALSASEGANVIESLLSRSPGSLPDLILIDFPVIDENSIKTICRIRRQDHPNPAPIVVLSPDTAPELVSRCYWAGATSVITKPEDAKELDEVLLHTTMYWLLLNQASYKSAAVKVS